MIQRCRQGNVAAAARDWTTAAGITGATGFGVKGGFGAVKGKMAPTPKTATPEPVTPKPAAKPATSSANTVAMGSNMGQRVIPYAERNGFDYYKGTPKYVPRKTIARTTSPATLDKIDLWFNKRWINGQMSKGNRIIDIGEPPGYPSSPFYNMELDQTRGYWNYFQDIQP